MKQFENASGKEVMKIWLVVVVDSEWDNEPNYNVFTAVEKAKDFIRVTMENAMNNGYEESECYGNADYQMENEDAFISIYEYELIAE